MPISSFHSGLQYEQDPRKSYSNCVELPLGWRTKADREDPCLLSIDTFRRSPVEDPTEEMTFAHSTNQLNIKGTIPRRLLEQSPCLQSYKHRDLNEGQNRKQLNLRSESSALNLQ